MSNVPHSVDSAIVSDMQRINNQQAPVQPVAEVGSPDVPRETMGGTENVQESKPDQESVPLTAQAESAKTAEIGSEPAAESKPDQKAESPIDEYGNPIAPPRMYTEDEVNEIMRRRTARGRLAEQPTEQQVQKIAQDFKHDPNSEETWETQLESFVERTIEKRQAKLNEQQWRAQEAQKQAEFEAKFSSGMTKYSDFNQVVQPMVYQGMLPDNVMLAVRTLENPAAFVYGAAKMYPKELERIARLTDAPSQALEIGRLHERMVKSTKIASNAPRPLDAPKGDMPPKSSNMPSLEERIQQHAKQKQARR